MSRLHQISEEDLATLERLVPVLAEIAASKTDRLLDDCRKAREILSGIRWPQWKFWHADPAPEAEAASCNPVPEASSPSAVPGPVAINARAAEVAADLLSVFMGIDAARGRDHWPIWEPPAAWSQAARDAFTCAVESWDVSVPVGDHCRRPFRFLVAGYLVDLLRGHI